ncbi:hypothetical protein C1645_828290, partial [Glomus cerebriforme]
MIEVSPNGTYLVTFSEEDKSIIGWNVENVEDMDEGQLKPDYRYTIDHNLNYKGIQNICVSDDKKLAYIYYSRLGIIDMNNDGQEIELNLKFYVYNRYHRENYYCTFNLKGEFIVQKVVYDQIDYSPYHNIIFVYSTQTKNNKWMCKGIYEIPEGYEMISISKYNKLYLLFSNNHIYEWDLFTEKSIKMFNSEEKIELRDIKISSNEKFICLKIKDKIIIYSIELKIPIITLDTNNDIVYPEIDEKQQTKIPEILQQTEKKVETPGETKEQTNVQTSGYIDIYTILLPLLSIEFCNSIMLDYWKKNNQLSEKDYQTEALSNTIQNFITKYVFRILDRYVWKINLEDKLPKMNFLFKTYENLNINLFNLYMNDINAFLQNYEDNSGRIDDNHYVGENDSIKWEIRLNDRSLELQVFKKSNGWESVCTRNDDFSNLNEDYIKLYGINLFKNNYVFIKTDEGFFIYHFNENDKSISLNYFYFVKVYNDEGLKKLQKVMSKPALPLPNFDMLKQNVKWDLDIIDNKESLLKYGVELLSFAIKEHNLESIDYIYKKCLFYFKEDLRNNKMFLSVITSTISLLDEYYPEYILKYSLETSMIINSYNIKHQSKSLHLHSQNLQMNNLSRSILWTKYLTICKGLKRVKRLGIIYIIFQCLVIFLALPILPILFAIFHLLLKCNFINGFRSEYEYFVRFFYYINNHFIPTPTPAPTTPTITFMIPYIKFVNYPKDYNWLLELIKPQPSPFAKIKNEDIYKTWNGEALINFKWNKYGKYYYTIIWISFMALLG